MKAKTADLIDAPLDWAVAECLGATRIQLYEYNGRRMIRVSLPEGIHAPWEPSRYWGQGGPIVEREKIATDAEMGDVWRARMEYTNDDSLRPQWSEEDGPTPLIAAMRCFVASRLGDEVDVPDELIKQP